MKKNIKETGKGLAKDLVNFGGEDFVNFDGQDAFVDLDGGTSITAPNEKKGFTVQISNVSDKNQKIVLFGGINPSKNPLLVQQGENALVDGEDPNIVVTPLSGDYNDFIEYLRNNPSLLVSAQISANRTEQIDTTIGVSYQNPFYENDKKRPIRLSRYRDQNTFNDKMVLAKLDVVTSRELVLDFTILAETVVTIEFHIGAGFSASKGIRKKADAEREMYYSRKSYARLTR